MNRVVVLGAGPLAREVLDVFLACNQHGSSYQIIGFIDENREKHGENLNGVPVLGDFSWFDAVDQSELCVIAGIGNPVSRRKVVNKALSHGLKFCNVVHPTAVLTPYVRFGTGNVVTAGSILTNQIRVENHVYVNLDCTIGHDCVIEDYCNISPGTHISGNVYIEQGCDIGTGAAIIQNIRIGHWTTVGAGAVVTKDLPRNVTAVGVPARIIKSRQEGWHER